MYRYVVMLAVVLSWGCASVEETSYKPFKNREKKAFSRADRSISISEVKTNFQAHVGTELAWAGIIQDVQYKETERTIQVAFKVEHREFDWVDHGGKTPYHLAAEGQGSFRAGWTVDKPARISYLKTLAKPGYMIVVYGQLYRLENEVVQLAATAVRPIKSSNFTVEVPEIGNVPEDDEGSAD